MSRTGHRCGNPARCVDCGQIFEQFTGLQKRCPACQLEHRRQLDRERAIERKRIKEKERERKKKESSVIINGHAQICTHMKSCFYGSERENGCAYAMETGHTRKSKGFYIVNGKCPAYKRKGKQRPKRTVPPAPQKKPDISDDAVLLVPNKKEFIDV